MPIFLLFNRVVEVLVSMGRRNKVYTEEVKNVIIQEDQLGITSHNKRSEMVEYNMDNIATALRDSIMGRLAGSGSRTSAS